MEKLHLMMELVEDGFKKPSLETYIDSMAEFRSIVATVNQSEDSKMIVAGDIAIRAGLIRTLYIQRPSTKGA